MRDKSIITVGAMVCITVIECFALMRGIDGAVLSTVIAAIAGLGGYSLAQIRKN